jgi:hypothetical protein
MVTVGLPPNVTARSVPGRIADSPASFATRTGPIVTGPVPNKFDRRSRTLDPPMLGRMI